MTLRVQFASLLIICLALISNVKQALASHASGANLTYQCVGPDGPDRMFYDVSLKFYRDCEGITYSGGPIEAYSSCGNILPGWLDPVDEQELSQLCDAQMSQSSCNGGPLPGVQEVTLTHRFSFEVGCEYWIKYSESSRNANIVNLEGSDGQNLVVQTYIDLSVEACNNSPVITSRPVPFVCAGSDVTFLIEADEPDGDSLSFEFTNALGGPDGPPIDLEYVNPYSATEPIPGINIDPVTGLIDFTAPNAGWYTSTVKIREYNSAGEEMGFVIKDFSFVVVDNCDNDPPDTPPDVGTVDGGASNGAIHQVDACADNEFCFDLTFDDPNGNNLELVSHNVDVLPGATVTTSGTNPLIATICWTGDAAHDGTNLVFTVRDDACPIYAESTYGMQINIVAECPPHPSFTFEEVCEGVDTDFTDTSAPMDSVYSWSWDFGDGNSSTDQNPSHTYAAAGTYTVALTINGGGDPELTTTRQVDVFQAPQQQELMITEDQGACGTAGTGGIAFEAVESEVGEPTALSTDVSFDFSTDNDPVSAPDEIIVSSVSMAGLTDTGIDGGIATTDWNSSTNWDESEYIEFTMTAPNGEALEFSPDDALEFMMSSTELSADDQYSVVYSTDGSTWNEIQTGNIPNPDNTSNISVFPPNFSDTDPIVLTFDVSGTALAGTSPVYAHTGHDGWVDGTNWGDNSAQYTLTDIGGGLHTLTMPAGAAAYYGANGNISVLDFVLRNAAGNAQTPDLSLSIPGATQTNVSMPLTDITGDKGGDVTFRILGSQVPAGSNIWVDNISLTGGNLLDFGMDYDLGNGPQDSGVFNGLTAGDYTLTVTNARGCESTFDISVPEMECGDVVASFGAFDACLRQSVAFTDSSTSSIDPITNWSWDFGDGNSSVEQNPDHTYAAAGTFTVSLTVSTGSDSASTTREVIISGCEDLTANFDAPDACVGAPVSFTDLSFSAFDPIDSWNWDFGDGNSSTAQNPGITYAAPGNYTVTLIVTAGSAADTATQVVTISGAAEPEITPIDTLCAGSAAVSLAADIAGGVWSGDNVLDSTYSPAATGTDTVFYNITTGCLGADTILIEVLPALDAEIDSVGPFCADADVIALTVNPTGGAWSGPGITDTDLGLFDPTFAGAGIHTITYELGGECTTIELTSIAVMPVDVLDDVVVGQFCQDDAPIELVNSSQALDWTGNGIVDNASGLFDPATAGPGDHMIYVNSTGDCAATDSVEVSVIPISTATILNNDTTLCGNGETLQMTASGNVGVWSGTGVNAAGIFDVNVSGPGEFDIVYEVLGLCANHDTVTITVLDPSNLFITHPGEQCVNNEPFVLELNTNVDGVWSGNGITNSDAGQFSPDSAGPGVHTITFDESSNCGVSASVDITVIGVPEVTILASDTIGCGQLEVTLTTIPALDSYPGMEWTWYISPDDRDANAAPTILFDPGKYTVDLEFALTENCAGTAMLEPVIEVFEEPVVDFALNNDVIFDIGGTIEAENLSTGITSHVWSVLGDSVTNVQDLDHDVGAAGWYPVELIGRNAIGCADTLVDSIQVYPFPTMYIPTAFTPNGDGVNDFFTPQFRGVDRAFGHMRIFDRWGDLIYEIAGYDLIWDGMRKSAPSELTWDANFKEKVVKSDVYTYSIEWRYETSDNEVHHELGRVTVLY